MEICDLNISVPSSLKKDLIACLSIRKPNFIFNIDYFLYIISKIINIPEFNDKLRNLSKIPIYSKILRYEIGKNYKKYLTYLIENGFLETDNHYIVSTPVIDGKCKCYGLPTIYRKSPLIEHQIQKKSLLKQLIKWKNKTFASMTTDETVLKLYEMMGSFTVDEVGATNDLDIMLSDKKITQRQHDMEINKCKRINGKNTKFSLFITKDNYSRIHTNFTNISKNIRENHLYLDGNKVAGIDIVSSQASMLGKMFHEYVNSIKYQIDNPLTETGAGLKRVDLREKYLNERNWIVGKPRFADDINTEFALFGKDSLDSVAVDGSKEVKKYYSIMDISGIYEFFQEKMDVYFDEQVTRDKIKKYWIAYVFGNGYSDDSPKFKYLKMIDTIWKYEFPLLRQLLLHFKRDDYKSLSHALQRMEADIVFNKICPEIDSKLGIKYCTVHDSLMVEESYCEEVAQLFDIVLKENNINTYSKYNNRY